MPGTVKSLLALGVVQGLLKSLIDRELEGPSDDARRKARAILVGVARNAKGDSAHPDDDARTRIPRINRRLRVSRVGLPLDLPFEVGPKNGREARESGLRLRARDTPKGPLVYDRAARAT
jgi:hypothetical protein